MSQVPGSVEVGERGRVAHRTVQWHETPALTFSDTASSLAGSSAVLAADLAGQVSDHDLLDSKLTSVEGDSA